MFLRVVEVSRKERTYRYLRVVENVRDAGRSVQRTLLNFGNVDDWPREKLASLIDMLHRFLGSEAVCLENVRFSECRQLGPYLPGAHLWEVLGMDSIIHSALKGRKIDIPVAACAEAMVLCQLVQPCSKKAVWESLDQEIIIPGLDSSAVELHACYRTLEYLSQAKLSVEKRLHEHVRTLFNQDLSLVFYDMTSCYFEGGECGLAKRGYSREHRPDLKQIEIGLLVDREGIPIGHEVFEGNVKEVTTVLGTLKRLKQQFGVMRCIFVGDDGMASETNLKAVEAEGYEYITSLSLGKSVIGQKIAAAPGWRSSLCEVAPNLWLFPVRQDGPIRYIASYNPERARSTRRHRKERLRKCLTYLMALRQAQQPTPHKRGRRTTKEQRLQASQKFIRQKGCHEMLHVRLSENGGLEWNVDRRRLRREKRMDGLLVLKTNSQTLTDKEVAQGYRTLWRVEDAFRHIKTPIELRPIRHWKDPRVLGHVFVCVLAYTLERLLDKKLEEAGLLMTARAAMTELRSITVATLEAYDVKIRRRSELTARQQKLLSAMGVSSVPALW
jgi:transposase